MRCCVLMGVSGCGASSVGKALQVLCDIDIVDRDDLHPRASIGKMRSVSRLMIRIAPRGPRTSFAGWPTKTVPSPSVIPRSGNNTATGYRSTWTSRSTSRISTFLATCCRDGWHIGLGISYPPSLLDSQFGAFERLDPDKWSSEVDIARPYAEVVARSEAYVRGAMI